MPVVYDKTIIENCRCGCSLTLTGTYESLSQARHKEWIDQHKACVKPAPRAKDE